MPKMVCIKCQTELEVLKIGVYVVTMMYDGTRPQPYKIWEADLWKCATCDTRIVAGFACEPLAIHHEGDFATVFTRIIGDPSTWVLYDFESPEQRKAADPVLYKNKYGGPLDLTWEQITRLYRILTR